MTPHTVIPQRPRVADHAAPPRRPSSSGGVGTAAVAQYSATLLPGVLYLLGVYVFDGAVPDPLTGTVGLLVTGLCTLVVGVARRRG